MKVYEDDEGREVYLLTDQGVCVGHMLAIADEADPGAVLLALLEGRDEL